MSGITMRIWWRSRFGSGTNSPISSQLSKKVLNLQNATHGLVAEWLGNGLQNRVQRFESARDLEYNEKPLVNQIITSGFLILHTELHTDLLIYYYFFVFVLQLHKKEK